MKRKGIFLKKGESNMGAKEESTHSQETNKNQVKRDCTQDLWVEEL